MNYPISMMIISRTPVRVSFCGGGTDVDWFSLSSENGGMVTSIAIDRYIHVTGTGVLMKELDYLTQS